MTNPVSLGTTSQATAQGGFIQVLVNGISVTAIAQTQIFPGQVTVWNENGVWLARTGTVAVATASRATIRRREPVAPPPAVAIITPFKAAIVRFDNLQVFKSADGANVFIQATVEDITDDVWLHNTGTDREQYLAFIFRGENLTIRGDISEVLEGWASGYFGQNYTNRGYDAVHHSVMVRTFEPSPPFDFYSSIFLEKETYVAQRDYTLITTVDFNGADPAIPGQFLRETIQRFSPGQLNIKPSPVPSDFPPTAENQNGVAIQQRGSWRDLGNIGRPASTDAVGFIGVINNLPGETQVGESTTSYLDSRYLQNAQYFERESTAIFTHTGGISYNALVDEDTGAFEGYQAVTGARTYLNSRTENDEINWIEDLSSEESVPNRMSFFHNRRREARTIAQASLPPGTPDTVILGEFFLDRFNIEIEIDIESLLLSGNGWYITRSGSFQYESSNAIPNPDFDEPTLQVGILPAGTNQLLRDQQLNYETMADCPKVKEEISVIEGGSIGFRASPFYSRATRYPELTPPRGNRITSTSVAEDYYNIKLDDVIDTYTLYQGETTLTLNAQSFYFEIKDRNAELDALTVGASVTFDLTLPDSKRTMGRSEYQTEKHQTFIEFTIDNDLNRINTVPRDDTEFNSFWAFSANAEIDLYWRSLNGFYQLAKGTVTLFEFTDTPIDTDRYAPYTRRNPVAITINITELVEGENPMIVSAQYSDRAGIVSSDNYFCLLKHEMDRGGGNYINSYLDDNTPTISICRVPTDSQAQTEREETATIIQLVGDKWQRQEPVRGTATAFNGSGSSKSLSYYPN